MEEGTGVWVPEIRLGIRPDLFFATDFWASWAQRRSLAGPINPTEPTETTGSTRS